MVRRTGAVSIGGQLLLWLIGTVTMSHITGCSWISPGRHDDCGSSSAEDAVDSPAYQVFVLWVSSRALIAKINNTYIL